MRRKILYSNQHLSLISLSLCLIHL
jgi:hypothetical protein